MSVHPGFLPDPERAFALDRRMHGELAASLAYLQERLEAESGEVPWLDPSRLEPPQRLVREGQRLAPLTFVAYYGLTTALMAGD